MKRRELIRHLEAHGCPLKREGGSHSIYWNPASAAVNPFPGTLKFLIFLLEKSAAHWKFTSPEKRASQREPVMTLID
jgi:hypothetical protein